MRLVKVERNGKSYNTVMSTDTKAGMKRLIEEVKLLVLSGDAGDVLTLTIEPEV